MIEKFSDYEGTQYLESEGEFVFEVMNAELTDSSNNNPMVKFDVQAKEGSSTIYKVLTPKARWAYNKFISACLNLTEKQKETFELDYEVIHNQLIGKKFIGVVEADSYEKEIKKLNQDGTYSTTTEERISYKIVAYKPFNA